MLIDGIDYHNLTKLSANHILEQQKQMGGSMFEYFDLKNPGIAL